MTEHEQGATPITDKFHFRNSTLPEKAYRDGSARQLLYDTLKSHGQLELENARLRALSAPAQQWIAVTERLPENQTYVLAIEPQTFAHPIIAYHSVKAGRHLLATAWIDTNGEYIDVTHWQPLPASPRPQVRRTEGAI